MKYLNSFHNFSKLFEFNRTHKTTVLEREKEFTVSYEIELESKSEFTDFYNELYEEFEKIFDPLVNKWDLDVDYDNSLVGFGDEHDFDEENEDESSMFSSSTYYSGIEIAPFEYFKGLNNGLQFISEFFKYYNKQNQFTFSKYTGLHINIGYYKNVQFNVLKAYLLLDEDKMAYQGYQIRKQQFHSRSYKENFRKEVQKYIDRNFDSFNHSIIIDNLEEINNDLNELLMELVENLGEKKIGFNISKLPDYGYIEFRHPGGELNEDTLIQQTLHYANIVLAAADKNYRKKEYYNKLINFLLQFEK